jgi:LysR family positive regulator for ilvC
MPARALGWLAAMDAGARLGAHAHRRLVPRETHEAILALIKLGCGAGSVLEKSPLRGELRVLDVRPRLAPFRVAACIKRTALKAPLTWAFWASIGG